MRSVAASVALQVTFSDTQNTSVLSGNYFRGPAKLKERLDCAWYQEFDKQFVKPIGGLHHAIHAPSLKSEDTLLADRYKDLSRELAIVDLIARAITSAPHLNTRANIRRAFQCDVLGLGGAFYKTTGQKRITAQEQARGRGEAVRYINDTTFDGLWDDAPRTIVLLYALADVFAGSKIKFASNDILSRLDCDESLLESLRRALRLYSTIVTDFAVLAGGKLDAAEAWRPVVAPTVARAKLPKLSSVQLRTLADLALEPKPRMKVPATKAGTRPTSKR